MRTQWLVTANDFADLAIEPLDVEIWMGRDPADVVANAVRFGPLARPLAEADPAAAAQAKAAIVEAMAPHATKEGVSLPGACWLVGAKRG